MKILLLFLALTTPAFAHTVEVTANGWMNDGFEDDDIARVKEAADRDANYVCTPEKAVRSSDYRIVKTRVEHGFRHGFMLTATASYDCED